MDANNRNLDLTIREHLNRFFAAYPNTEIQERAARALTLLLANKSQKKPW